MDFPEIIVFDSDESEAEAAADLARHVAALEIRHPMVLSSQHGRRLSAGLATGMPPEVHRGAADQERAAALGSRAHEAGADAIIAVGGGRCLDIGKLGAARAGVPLVAVPTQLSHDGICSPVAVVPNEAGRAESIGAVAPMAVFVSLPTLITAPVDSLRAGLGDLLANPLALRDWALAADRGLETIDQRSWDLSVQSFEMVEDDLDRDPLETAKDPQFVRRLADALSWSGMAMISAGTSRPASGGEHEVSHAIDELFGGKAMHGAQVAFGCIISVALHEEDTDAFRGRLRSLGLPEHPANMGLTRDDVVAVLLHAPETRPGRFTIIEHANLTDASARTLIERIWDRDSP